jgi:hypothetical protein
LHATGAVAQLPEAAEPDATDTVAESSGIALYSADGVEFRAGLQAGLAVVTVRNAGAGAGTRSRRDGATIRSPSWADGFVKPGLTFSLDREATIPGIAYGGLSVISAWTLGDGDAYAPPGGTQATRGGIAHTDLESLYLGWRSATQAGRSADGVDVSVGRQEFVIGDGFLIGDGHYDKGKDAGYYSGGRLAWTDSAILSAARLPLRADLFWLKGDKNSGGSDIAGINAERTLDDAGTIGAGWMHVLDDNAAESGYTARRGMQVWDLRGQLRPLGRETGLSVAAEWARETNSAGGVRHQNATGWYGEIGYGWRSLAWTPSLTYRHAHFSGDKEGTTTDETWDPLRYGAVRGWGTWFMGEIVGQYMLFNSNEDVHMLHAKLAPSDALTLGAIFYVFRYDHPDSVFRSSGGTGVASDDFGREMDVYADWAPLPYLSLSAVLGVFAPGKGAKQAYSSGKTTGLLETLVGLRF